MSWSRFTRFLSRIAKDAKDPYAGLDEERFEGKLDELLELINSTQETWKAYAVAAASEEYHGGGTGASLRYSYTYIDKMLERIKELMEFGQV